MKFVAITSCPTGIAHSQMAAENIQTTAERLGHEIKVEVQGAMGAENELTAAEIADADAVIIAADTSVSRDRFEGKPLVKGTVKDGVNDAESLIEEAVEAAGGDGSAASDAEGESDAPEDGGESDDGSAEGASTDSSAEDRDRPRGGDREKGLFARLKRLFS